MTSRKKKLDTLLKTKYISQAEYNERVKELDEESAAKKKEIEEKALARHKAIAIVNAIISTATGVAAALEYGFPAGIVLAAIMAAAGAVEIATIASQKVPEGRDGLVIQGPRHSEGGIDMVANGKRIANIEGGEPVMVLSRNTYGNNKDLIDNLIYNSQYRNGAPVAPKWMTSTPTVNAGLVQRMANGGVANSTAGGAGYVADSTQTALMAQMVHALNLNNQYMAAMPRNLKAQVVFQEIKDADDTMRQVKAESGLRQG